MSLSETVETMEYIEALIRSVEASLSKKKHDRIELSRVRRALAAIEKLR